MRICEQFVGRLRDLCEGAGRDGRPDPTREATDGFRTQYGLIPLSDDPQVRAAQLAEEADVAAVAISNPAWNVIPATGPGRELEQIFEQLEIPYKESCGCAAYARQMDLWGVAGCFEHFDEIVERLRTNAEKYTLWEQFNAAGRALQTGLAFHLNPLDPFPGLVSEAIRRAKLQEGEQRPADITRELQESTARPD